MNREPNHAAVTSLQLGWSELGAACWPAARDAFRASLETRESPEAHEGLSWAAWWLDEADAVFGARERAFHLYRQHGDRVGAARMATWLAADHLDFHGALAVAGGWLRRARRLLEPLEPVAEHGWLAFHEGYVAAAHGDSERSSRLAAHAAELGRRFAVPDLEMLGLALQGSVLVACGNVAEGMSHLDEAAATALTGEATIPISRAWTCCFLVGSCEAVRDFPRAGEWCDRIAEFSHAFGSRYMLAFCREHYGALHMWKGRWKEAEAELEEALAAYTRSRPAFAPAVRVVLAELRRRQGRLEDAARLLGDERRGPALLCSAWLALDRGEPRHAVELAERMLRRLPPERRLDRFPALELLVVGRAACGEPSAAASALAELRGLAILSGTAPATAAAALAAGILAAAGGEHERARCHLEDAVDGFTRSGTPFEAARARVALAASLLAMGRDEEAEREAAVAASSLADLGAEAEAARARRVRAAALGGREVEPPLAILTRREREVLCCAAHGLTNRQIAERLVISEHTVHRHVTNFLRKLALPSRTAAAALAARAGLLDSSEEVARTGQRRHRKK